MSDATAPAVSRQSVLVFVGLQFSMILSSMDGTIVATALPSITDDLGGFSRVTWVATSYLLSLVATMPLWGKVGDLYGRKQAVLAAVAIFLLGSMACGVAQSMNQLLAARFLQGIGSGGIGSVSMAVIADIFPARQLGRWLGYQGIVFAGASVIGPVAGGLFVDHLSWRWAFYINVPFGLLGIALVALHLRVPYRRLPHALDWPGALLLVGALTSFVVVASVGGHDFGWVSATTAALIATFVLLGAAFIARQRRAPEPVLPLRLFADAVIRIASVVNFTSGLLFYCTIYFVPLFMQEVRGVSPTKAGLTLVPLMFGAAAATGLSGRFVERTGRLRLWPILGSAIALVGMLLLATLGESTWAGVAAGYVFLVGIGVGCIMQPSLLAAQNAAPVSDLGTATSTALLFRMLAGTIGVPIFGGILNAGLPDGARTAAGVADALGPVFLAAVPVAVVSIAAALRLQERPLREQTLVAADVL